MGWIWGSYPKLTTKVCQGSGSNIICCFGEGVRDVWKWTMYNRICHKLYKCLWAKKIQTKNTSLGEKIAIKGIHGRERNNFFHPNQVFCVEHGCYCWCSLLMFTHHFKACRTALTHRGPFGVGEGTSPPNGAQESQLENGETKWSFANWTFIDVLKKLGLKK